MIIGSEFEQSDPIVSAIYDRSAGIPDVCYNINNIYNKSVFKYPNPRVQSDNDIHALRHIQTLPEQEK